MSAPLYKLDGQARIIRDFYREHNAHMDLFLYAIDRIVDKIVVAGGIQALTDYGLERLIYKVATIVSAANSQRRRLSEIITSYKTWKESQLGGW